MTSCNAMARKQMKVTEIEEFVRKPPAGFSVKTFHSGYRVHSNDEESLVLIDDFQSRMGKIVFHNSLGRKVTLNNLWEYTSFRKSLLSKKIYLLMCSCEQNMSVTNNKEGSVPRQYVVSLDGSNPFIKWQMEKGLDWTISSVAGESYRVDIDLSEAMESLIPEDLISHSLTKVKPVWTDTSFTLKYYSDALFDFPHWFGFSKRTFKVTLT